MQYIIGLAVIGIIVVLVINRKSPAYRLGGILIVALAAVAAALFYHYALSFDDVGQLILAGMFTVVFLIVLYFVIFLARKKAREYAAAAPERRELREEKQRLRMQEAENKRQLVQAERKPKGERPSRRRLDVDTQMMEELAGRTVGEVLANSEPDEALADTAETHPVMEEEFEVAPSKEEEPYFADWKEPVDVPVDKKAETQAENAGETVQEEVLEPVELEIEHEEELEYQVEDAMEPETREAVFVDEHQEPEEPETTEEEKKNEQMKELLGLIQEKQKQQALEKVFMMLGEYQWSSDEKQKLKLVLLTLENSKE